MGKPEDLARDVVQDGNGASLLPAHDQTVEEYNEIQNVPRRPESLDKGWGGILGTVVSLLMVSAGLALLGFAVVVARLDGKPMGQAADWDMLQNICNKVCTVFVPFDHLSIF